MKKIFLITCCLFLGINISLSEMVSQREMVMGVQLEGEKFIDSKCPIRKANHSFNEVVFEVNAPSGGNYWISFWMCAPLLKNGDYSNYTVWVNERDSVGIISTKSPDWQCVTFDVNKPVLLKKGKNSISVRGKSSLFPNVERIRLSIKPDNSIIDGTQYQKYIGDIDQEVAPESKFEQETTPVNLTGKNFKGVELLASSSQDPPLYNYNYALDFPFSYTFHTDLHLNEGENIDISAKGWNYFSYKLYLFNIEDPTSYSWSANSSTSNYLAMLNVKAPKTGTYKIFLTSFFPDRKGKCDININDSIQYNRVPVSYSGLLCSGIEDMSTEYNVFTCNSTEDTELYLLKTAGFNKDVIFAYNDDANFNSDYDWDCNSRLRVCFPTNTITALICPYSSSAPEGICDVYLNCKDSNIISYFPLLKKDDAIQSSPESIVYNCISWSAGITTDWHWPPSEDSDYYSEDPLEAFDNYYKAFGLTRSGATRENAIVALWGIVDNNGDIEYTHASVTRGDGNVHGYDWESKPGSLMRTFHPCDALEGLDYGKILEYYTLNQQESRLNKSIEIINSKTDSISFDSVEKNIIYDNIHRSCLN